jgi:hypothetical protein
MNNDSKTNIQNKTARIISVIFHPVFMVFYGLTILLFAPTFLGYLPLELKKILFLVVIVNNVLVPLALLPIFRYRNLISSYDIEDRSERIVPLLTASILYCTTSFIIFRFQIPFLLKSFIFATSVLSIIVSVINFWWKISIHSVGAGAMTATVLVLSLKMHTPLTWHLVGSIMISGLILSARLRLNSHNLSQVWIGFFTGLLGIGLFILLV